MPRVFVAIPLPADVAADLDRRVPALPGLRRVEPARMHVTLAFLGQVGEERIPDVVAAVEAASALHGPFDVDLGAVGRFPEHGRPRVVWAGAGPRAADAIVRLGASVRAELLRRRLQFDPKPLRTHVTLGRVREDVSEQDARAMADALARARGGPAPVFRTDAVHVVESKLSSKGPLYSSRAQVTLKG